MRWGEDREGEEIGKGREREKRRRAKRKEGLCIQHDHRRQHKWNPAGEYINVFPIAAHHLTHLNFI